MNKYSGLVIGGPKAGEYVEHEWHWFKAAIYQDDFDVISVYSRGLEDWTIQTYEVYTYKHIRGFCDDNPMNFWIEDKPENTLSTCFYELRKFYMKNAKAT